MATPRHCARALDHSMPAASTAALGSTLLDVLAALADLQKQHAALLAKLDAANVAGGNNAATVGLTLPVVTALGTRTPLP